MDKDGEEKIFYVHEKCLIFISVLALFNFELVLTHFWLLFQFYYFGNNKILEFFLVFSGVKNGKK